jgi:hypothetical protein
METTTSVLQFKIINESETRNTPLGQACPSARSTMSNWCCSSTQERKARRQRQRTVTIAGAVPMLFSSYLNGVGVTMGVHTDM